MSQHFLLSAKAKTLTLAQVFRMTEAEAETMFRKVRWPETDGEAVCPKCGCLGAYGFRRPKGAFRFECRDCGKEFSITSGTLFASHKLPLKAYLAAIAIFAHDPNRRKIRTLHRLGPAGRSSGKMVIPKITMGEKRLIIAALAILVIGFFSIHNYVARVGFFWNVMHGEIWLSEPCEVAFYRADAAPACRLIVIPYRWLLGALVLLTAAALIVRKRT
jgi:transposase-like protein